MRPSLLLLAASVARAALSSEPFSFPGQSVGSAFRFSLTARLTFDRRRAAGGGMIYAVSRATARDEDCLAHSVAVVIADNSWLGSAALAARRRGLPALALPQARFSEGALELSMAELGPEKRESGFLYRLVERSRPTVVREGDVVTVTPEGALLVWPRDRQEAELALAEALRAYDGLRDGRALARWLEGRKDDPQALRRFFDELSRRVCAGTARAEDYSLAARVDRRAAAVPVKARSAELAARLDGIAREARDDAASAEAVERLRAEGAAARRRFQALAEAAGTAGAAPSGADFERVARQVERRLPKRRSKGSDPLIDAARKAGAETAPRVEVPASLYRRFLESAGLQSRIREIIDDPSLDARRRAERVQRLWSAEPPPGLPGLALPAGSYYLVVSPAGGTAFVPRDGLPAAVGRAWAAHWSAPLIAARRRSGDVDMAPVVVIEGLSAAQASGVVLSRDGDGPSGRVVVAAVLGEGAGLSGAQPADEYVLDRQSGREALPPAIADKRTRQAWGGNGFKAEPVPPGLSLSRALSPRQLERVARLARALEVEKGEPVEAAFAFRGDALIALSWRSAASGSAVVAGPLSPPR